MHHNFLIQNFLILLIFTMEKIELMNSASTTRSINEPKSARSSFTFQRIVRKPDDRSNSRRSLSNKSSEKSLNSIDMSHFFVRMNRPKENVQSEEVRIKNRVFNRTNEPRAQKKRCSTPIPGYRGEPQQEKLTFTKKSKENVLQNDLLITELEIKFNEQRKKTLFYEKKVEALDKDLKIKNNKIEEIEIKLGESIKRQLQTRTKFQNLQQFADKSQSTLSQTKSNLQKMKKMIMQTRSNQLQLENIKLRKENSTLKQQIQNLIHENSGLQEQYKIIHNQNLYLQGLNSRLSEQGLRNCNQKQIQNLNNIISQTKSQRQQLLEEIIQQKKEQEAQYKLTIDKLEIKINYLNRKNNEQMQSFKEKKNTELINIRNKLSLTNKQYYDLKKETEKMKRKNIFAPNLTNQKPRASIMTTNNSWSRDDQIQFYLSPEK